MSWADEMERDPSWPAYDRRRPRDADLIDEVRKLCLECRTPAQSATAHGYTCPTHYLLLAGQEMPTVSEIDVPPMYRPVARYVVIYRTRAGYVAAWSDHATDTEAIEKARERVAITQRHHWVARVFLTIETTEPVVLSMS